MPLFFAPHLCTTGSGHQYSMPMARNSNSTSNFHFHSLLWMTVTWFLAMLDLYPVCLMTVGIINQRRFFPTKILIQSKEIYYMLPLMQIDTTSVCKQSRLYTQRRGTTTRRARWWWAENRLSWKFLARNSWVIQSWRDGEDRRSKQDIASTKMLAENSHHPMQTIASILQ
jgi:hypothetical protein